MAKINQALTARVPECASGCASIHVSMTHEIDDLEVSFYCLPYEQTEIVIIFFLKKILF
jgi:hypothetical protein